RESRARCVCHLLPFRFGPLYITLVPARSLPDGLRLMAHKTNRLVKFGQFGRFALMGIPQDAVCSVDVTNQCNLRCHHCYFFEHEQPENLAVERWRSFFDKMKAEGFPFFSCSWVGGEPLMRP